MDTNIVDYIPISAAADFAGVSRITMKNWIERGIVRARTYPGKGRTGLHWFVDPTSLARCTRPDPCESGRFLPMSVAAARTGTNRWTLMHWLKTGKVAGRRRNGSCPGGMLWDVDTESLQAWLEHRGQSADEDQADGWLDRIFNEDCLSGMDRIPDKSVDFIFTDLPYGTTQNKWDTILPLDVLWKQYERVIKTNGAIVLTATQPFTTTLVESNPKLFKYSWVWEKSLKTNFLNAKKQPLRNHEDILVFYSRQPVYNPQGLTAGSISGGNGHTGSYGKWKSGGSSQQMTGYPASVLYIPNPNQGSIHPTQKPVALLEYLISTYTNEGAVVLDACMGSGTTAIAAMNLRRHYVGFEMNKDIFNSCRERITSHEHNPTKPVQT